MGCFDNLVGIRGHCDNPTSGILLNEVGVSVSELDKLATQDYESGVDLFNEKYDYSVKILTNRIYTHFSDKFRPHSILSSGLIGRVQDDLGADSGALNSYRGIRVQSCSSNGYIDFYVTALSLFTDFTGDVAVNVIDLKQGRIVDTITVSAVANQLTRVDVNKTYNSYHRELDFLFVYDSSAINAYRVTLDGTGCTGCSGNSITTVKFGRHIKVTPVEMDTNGQLISTNVTSRLYTGGMLIDYSVQCNHEHWLCGFKNLLALPIAQLTAAVCMKYGRFESSRANDITITDMDKLEERMDLYMSEYESSYKNILHHIQTPNDRDCFVCNRRQRTITQAM